MTKKADHVYTNDFFDYIQEGALASARVIVPIVCDLLAVKSILDVGCGVGGWLCIWQEQPGIHKTVGMDGQYVSLDTLMISHDAFRSHDLSEPFDLEEHFDLACCLEVAEHIPRQAAASLVQSLCRHADHVLFSAATPGQAGMYHVNEQPYSYWRDLFRQQGFSGYDCIRPRIRNHANVEPWYRYNTFLYSKNGLPLSRAVEETKLSAYGRVEDISPLSWRARKAVFRFIPTSLSTLMSKAYHTIKIRNREKSHG